jgi:trans-2,3-dihydro-3-hydroxyanthranilate isomerase
MPTFKYFTCDVFTDKRFGGNQLAVFPDAKKIPPRLYQDIAREFNYSETTFVLPPKDKKHTKAVKIWTPGGELQFAGHPTVGTAMVLGAIGAVKLKGAETRIVLEEGVGPVPVTIRAKGGKPTFAQLTVAKLPEYGPPAPKADDLARALSLEPGDVLSGEWHAEAASCGTWFLLVPLRNRGALGRARVRMDEFERVLKGYVTDKVFLFCHEPELRGSHYRARMYAPTIGVPEDPATGSAAAGFAGYLAKRDRRTEGTLSWRVEQGFEMGRPSILDIEADKSGGAVTGVRVGGKSVLVMQGELTV